MVITAFKGSNRAAAVQAAEIRLQQLVSTRPFDDVAWERIFAHDIHLRIGNAASIIGKTAVLVELRQFFDRLESMGIGYWECCIRRETIFAEVEIQFLDSVGNHRRIPCVIAARMSSRSLLDLRFSLDPSPIPLLVSTSRN